MGNQCKNLFTEDEASTLNINKKDSPKRKAKIKEIEDYIRQIMKLSIFKRDEIAKNKYKNFLKMKKVKKINDVYKEYIEILKLLLLNDTNKNIVTLYLNFLKNNKNFIESNGFNSFKEEIEKYKVLFTMEEINKIEIGIKMKSEKDNFLDLLDKLQNVNIKNKQTVDDIFSLALQESKNIKYFNYPIEFSNQELFYYKMYILLIMEIAKMENINNLTEEKKNDFILNKIKIAQKVLKNDVLHNQEIINNEDKMNILLILILYDILDENNESSNFNRFLQTKPAKYEELTAYLSNNKIGKIIGAEGKEKIYLEHECNIQEVQEVTIIYTNDICLNNIKTSVLRDLQDIYILNTLGSLLTKNNIIPYMEKIKLLLKSIVESKAYKEAIIKLFPEYYEFLLSNNVEELKDCIDDRLKFYPYENLGNSGLTDKFSCYSYVPIFYFIVAQNKLFNILRIGAVIENSLHELNHMNQDILYFKGNDKKLFYSPKREHIAGEDGGENLEVLLFGRKVSYIRILECLYILNEQNYNQSLNDFRANFKKLYDKSIGYDEKMNYLKDGLIFKEFFDLIKIYKKPEDLEKIELNLVSAKRQESSFDQMQVFEQMSVSLPRKYCKMGL